MRLRSAAMVTALCFSWQFAWGQSVGQQLLAALDSYRLAVLDFDVEREVASFTEDAELALGSDPVVQGRTTIRSMLSAPSSAKVLAFELHASATRVEGKIAFQNGVYLQRYVSAEHQSILEKGVFEVQWTRQVDGSWLISRLHTDPIESSRT